MSFCTIINKICQLVLLYNYTSLEPGSLNFADKTIFSEIPKFFCAEANTAPNLLISIFSDKIEDRKLHFFSSKVYVISAGRHLG